jgi:hypothetical protein
MKVGRSQHGGAYSLLTPAYDACICPESARGLSWMTTSMLVGVTRRQGYVQHNELSPSHTYTARMPRGGRQPNKYR